LIYVLISELYIVLQNIAYLSWQMDHHHSTVRNRAATLSLSKSGRRRKNRTLPRNFCINWAFTVN